MERSIVTYLQHRTSLIESQCINAKEKLGMSEEDIRVMRTNFDHLEQRVKDHFEKQLNYRHTMGSLEPFRNLPQFYYINILDSMFGEFFRNPRFEPARYLTNLENFNVIYPELLAAVREEVYTRDNNSWEFIIDPLTQQLDDFIIVQFGECEVYTKKDWYQAMHAKLDRTDATRNIGKWPAPLKWKSKGTMIGFREFILKQRVHCVVIPSEQSHLVSILRIPRSVFRHIISSSIRNRAYRKFKQFVSHNVPPEVERKDVLRSKS